MAWIRERTTRKHGRVWDVGWTAGEHERSEVAHSLDEALLMKIAVEKGQEPRKLVPDDTLLGTFWDGFEQRWQQGKAVKTVETMRHSRRTLQPLMGVPVAHLTAAMVEDTIAAVAATAPRQAQISLSHLKKALRNAQTRDHAVDPRIFTLTPPRYESREIRFLTWPEVDLLASFLHPQVQRIVPFAALTGMRKRELFTLTDKQVGDGFVTLRVTKTKRPRKVWLSGVAQQLLREQLLARAPNGRGLVFPTASGGMLGSRFDGAYRKAVGYAGLEGTTFHSLRHTCASLMIRAGCNPLEIAEQLGHMRGGKPDPSMIWQRYGWLYEGATREAVRRLDDVVAAS